METNVKREAIKYGVLLPELSLIYDFHEGDVAVIHTISGSLYIVENINGGVFISKSGDKKVRVVDGEIKVGKSINAHSFYTSMVSDIRVGKENQCMKFDASSEELSQLRAEMAKMNIQNRIGEIMDAAKGRAGEAIDNLTKWLKSNRLEHFVSAQLNTTPEEDTAIKQVINEVLEGSSKINDVSLIKALRNNDVKAVVNWVNSNLQ